MESLFSILEKSIGFLGENAGTSAILSTVFLDILLRVYPKGVPLLELAGRGLYLVGSLFVKVSELLPNKKPEPTS